MKAEFIIEKPENQRPLQRATFAFITIVAWTLWISLWMPVLTAIAWLLGVQNTYKQLGLVHPLHAVDDLKLVVMVALVSSLSIGTWSQYNRMRFPANRSAAPTARWILRTWRRRWRLRSIRQSNCGQGAGRSFTSPTTVTCF
jgi:poly-beta-1,6-N-acetyl-D-glucosamine biosynthesis protein PgaD